MTVADQVAASVRRHGSVPVDVVVAQALYARPGGFYESGGSAGGRGGHFLTSPEVGPLFGAVVARALDSWWTSMGRPDPFVVVEAGAGPGTLCRSVLAADPACVPALRYVLVERSDAQRGSHREVIRLEEPALAFAPLDQDTEQPVPGAPEGPICVSLAELPRVAGPVVVLANELLDNLPFGLAQRHAGRWHEVRVTERVWADGRPAHGTPGRSVGGPVTRADGAPRAPGAPTAHAAGAGAGPSAGTGVAPGAPGETPCPPPGGGPATAAHGAGSGFAEVLVPLDDERARLLDRLAPDAGDGARVPLQAAARRWLQDALALAAPGGRVAAFDYATTTAALASRPQDEWLRTYRGHARGGHYLDGLGAQDVTCEVALDQLALVRPPAADRGQAEWLRSHGLDELVDAARRAWDERASVGDLAALAARSRVTEAAALTDPAGLGAFRVVEWTA